MTQAVARLSTEDFINAMKTLVYYHYDHTHDIGDDYEDLARRLLLREAWHLLAGDEDETPCIPNEEVVSLVADDIRQMMQMVIQIHCNVDFDIDTL